jgi:hypothetical protein
VFGVLVVFLRRDYVAGLSLSLGQREIPLIASLRILRAPRLGVGDIRCPLRSRNRAQGLMAAKSIGHIEANQLG